MQGQRSDLQFQRKTQNCETLFIFLFICCNFSYITHTHQQTKYSNVHQHRWISQLISTLLWTRTEDFPMNTRKKSKWKKWSDFFYYFADIHNILGPLSQIWKLFWQRFARILCFWWKKEINVEATLDEELKSQPPWKTKDEEIPRTWALVKSMHHPPSQTHRN